MSTRLKNAGAGSTAPPDSALQLVGRTPLVKLRGFDTGACELYLKLESQNPGGSIKDRIGLSMVAAAEPQTSRAICRAERPPIVQ